jgi:DnaJ-class molecular chaperone
MRYDTWKALDYGEPPEVWETCPDCCGEGAIEVWESVSKWSIDPPCAISVPCKTCAGAGGWIEDAA